MATIKEHFKTYGETYKGAVPFAAGLCTKDPELIEFILTTKATTNKSVIYLPLKNWLGEGLFLAKYESWRLIKKMAAPAFHYKLAKQSLPVFNKNSEILVQQMTSIAEKNGGDIDIFLYVSLAALLNIIEPGLGTSINSQLNGNSDFVKATNFMTHQICDLVWNHITYIRAIYMFTINYWRERKAINIIKKFTMKIINFRRTNLFKSQSTSIDILLHATLDGKPLSDEFIANKVGGYLFAGYDTVNSALTCTLFSISQYPAIQAKIIDEQRSIFGGDSEREATMGDLNTMTYLEMVIKEGLRICTVAPYIARSASENIQYKSLHIRKGTQLVVAIGELHHDPEIYPSPDEFIPERFLPEEQTKRHPYAYLPFNGGHRNCMGQKFAMLELKATISKVCRDLELAATDPPHKCNLLTSIVLISDNGVFINVKRRQW